MTVTPTKCPYQVKVPEGKHRSILRYPVSEWKARRKVAAEIEALDPEVDYTAINKLLIGKVFGDPLFFDAVFTLAYWRQIAVRTIAPVLHQAGSGATYDTNKRVDDTLLFFGFIQRDGPDSERGGQTIDRLAALHQGFPIPPDDYRYTCASLCFEAVRIPEILGCPGLTEKEQRALFLFWRGVGRRWGMDIPENQAEFRAWWEQYERDTYQLSPEGPGLAVAMADDFCRRFFPGPLKKLGYIVIRSFGDDFLCDVVGQPRVKPITRAAVGKAIGVYVRARRFLPASSEVRLLGAWANLYPAEPTPEDIGPTWSEGLTAESRTRRSASAF